MNRLPFGSRFSGVLAVVSIVSVFFFLTGRLSAEDRYFAWCQEKFGAEIAADPDKKDTVWGPLVDFDLDRLTNLLEFTLDLDPKTPSRLADALTIKTSQNPDGSLFMQMEVTQRKDDPALQIVPQFSEDPRTNLWNPQAAQWDGDSPWVGAMPPQPVGTEFDRITYYLKEEVSVSRQGFMRLQVTRDEATVTSPGIDPLTFTANGQAPAGSTVQSNAVVLQGFVGTVPITVTSGVDILVNGENRGSSTTAQNGDRIVLSTNAPGNSGQSLLANVSIGDYQTSWKTTGQAIAPLANPAGTASGNTPVQVGASESGAAQISIPIVCSPGAGGIQPELSIGYSSQGGNGLLGMGFSLSGLPKITRAPQTLAQDGKKTGVTLSLEDRYSLDGQRLIAIDGPDGGDGTRYRTEIDGFSDIRSFLQSGNGPGRFEVRTKSGLTYRFAHNSNSRIFPEGSNTPMMWSVNRIEDTVGNYLDVFYDEAARLRGEWLPRRISYTHNGGAGGGGSQEVHFFYQNRPDTRTSYIAGHAAKSTKRLTAIECQHAGQQVRRYEFAYDNSGLTNVTHLVSVTEVGTDGTAFPPTVFEWDTNNDPDFEVSDDTIPQSWPNDVPFDRSPPAQMVVGDFDGNGLMEILKMNDHGTNWLARGQRDGTLDYIEPAPGLEGRMMSSSDAASRLRTGDFNADGRTDILHLYYTSTTNWLALSGEDNQFHVREGVDRLGDLASQTFKANKNSELLTFDVNGDGRSDVIYLESGKHAVHLCQPDGRFSKVADPGLGDVRVDEGYDGWGFLVPGDYNGDGLGDILYLYRQKETSGSNPRQTWLALSNGDGTFTVRKEHELPSLAGIVFAARDSWMMNGDFNGDGLSDVYCVIPNAFSDNWMILSKGDGSFDYVQSPAGLENPPLSVRTHSHVLAGDYNGDGLTDLFHAEKGTPNRHWMAYSQGDGSFKFLPYADLGPLKDRVYRDPEESRFFPADYDGDGRTDLVHLDYNTTKGYHLKSTGYDLKRIVKVTNGHGGYTKINYHELTDPALYTKGNSANYPCHDFVAPIYVVSDLITRNGADGDPYSNAGPHPPGESMVSYLYREAWMCLDGRGFRGFKCIETKNHTTGITTLTKYDERPLAAGRPVFSEQRLATGELITQSENEWEVTPPTVHPTGNKTYRVRQSHSTERLYEITSGQLYKTTETFYTEFDEFDNVREMTVNYGGGFSERTESDFDNIATNSKWHLGRLRQSQVTKAAPGAGAETRTSAFDYDGNTGLLIREIIEPGGGDQRLEKTYLHDGFGNIVESTLSDPATGQSRTTRSEYSNDGRFEIKTINALGHEETKEFDQRLGNVTKQTGPNGIATMWEYDPFGRPTREYRRDGTETKTWYFRAVPGVADAPPRSAHLVMTQTSGGELKSIYYDVLDREIATRVTGFDGSLIHGTTVYNERGEAIRKSDPYYSGDNPFWTDTLYDAIGRPTMQTAPGGRSSRTNYNGLVTAFTNPKGQVTVRRVNQRGKVVEVTDDAQSKLFFEYDANGNVTRITDPNGIATTIQYDLQGNKIAIDEPNTGLTQFEHNAFGELIRQVDAKGQVVTLRYDNLGRLVERLEPEGRSTWAYDTAPLGVGKIAFETGPGGISKTYRYDNFGRPASTITRIDNRIYTVSTSYDQYSRVHATTYPTGFAVHNVYNAFGFLTEIRKVGTNSVLWQAQVLNARGQIEQESAGGGASSTARSYEADTGLLQSIQTNASGNTVQDLSYQFDVLNNLVDRTDHRHNLSEGFDYDNLNRLVQVSGTGGLDPVAVTYDEIGNITSRSDVGTYHYGQNGAGPHALTGITGITGSANGHDASYSYDANGNRNGGAGKQIAYTSFNKPHTIETDDSTVRFSYGPDRSRFRQSLVKPDGKAEIRHYISGLYEFEEHGDHERHVHYVRGGGGVFLAHTITIQGGAHSQTDYYLHRDHLGSVETITDSAGNQVEALNYDSWGRRRNLSDDGGNWLLSYTPVALVSEIHRGFTGHEMLDTVGLVHMNGRVYDPVAGRFLSADPFVQAPENLQSLNRYSYVLNNPLSYTDPSGFFWKKIAKFIGKSAGLGLLSNFLNDRQWAQAFSIGVGVALSTVFAPLGPFIAGFAGGFGSAFSGTLLAGGSLGDALKAGVRSGGISALSAGVTKGVSGREFLDIHDVKIEWTHEFAGKILKKTIAHGFIQGGVTELQGGKFSHGFLSGAASGAGSPFAQHSGLGVIGTAIVGGTASSLGGGKFANGAMAGATVYLFNQAGKPTVERGEEELWHRRFDISNDEGLNKFVSAANSSNFHQAYADGDLATLTYMQKDVLVYTEQEFRKTFRLLQGAKAYGVGMQGMSAITTVQTGAAKAISHFYNAVQSADAAYGIISASDTSIYSQAQSLQDTMNNEYFGGYNGEHRVYVKFK